MLKTLIFAVFCLYWCQGSPEVKLPLGKVAGHELLYNFGLHNFFPPRAVTIVRYKGLLQYNVFTKTYLIQPKTGL